MKHPALTSSDSFNIKDVVELRGSDGPTQGRVVATRDAAWLYVLWHQRQGHEGKVTIQQASDLRKLSTKTSAARYPW
jgi:hypothetical protein